LTFDIGGFQKRKSGLLIVIFGSYTHIARLEELRECLKSDGYAASLVTELEYPVRLEDEIEDVYNVRKSFYWLENSGANFLVFFRGIKNEGVSLELERICSNHPQKLSATRVFFDGGPAEFSSMIRGEVKDKKILFSNFSTDRNLCEFAKGAALDVLTSV